MEIQQLHLSQPQARETTPLLRDIRQLEGRVEALRSNNRPNCVHRLDAAERLIAALDTYLKSETPFNWAKVRNVRREWEAWKS